MNKHHFLTGILILYILIFESFTGAFVSEKLSDLETIHGVNFVAPPKKIAGKSLEKIEISNAEWVSVIPYAYSRPAKADVQFNVDWQWWGEKPDGIRQTINFAHKAGFRVMIKPQIWVMGQGWPGEYDLHSELEWKKWEEEYSNYIMTYARLGKELNAEMLCIGTEVKIATSKRPGFWRKLIEKIRNVYDGKLTYAANWDNYDNIEFWDMLDYIGVDAYWPLSKEKTPSTNQLLLKWQPIVSELEKYHYKWDKPILFTEYGYMSVDYAAGEQWELENNPELNLNMQAQTNSYEALYRAFSTKKWFAGGFLWKWFSDHENAGGLTNKAYTPQNKPVMQVIKKWYK